jgi:Na+-translocating ferredoxin:NAD+ oxidoreductase RnfG subunit
LLVKAGEELRPSLPQRSVRALAGELRVEQSSTVLSDTANKIDYFRVFDANDKLTGYIFSSLDLAPEVHGFGGRINLAVYVDDPNGEILGFHIIQSNETPAYLALLDQWCDSLVGHHLFESEPFADIQAVTGATISSEAILAALRTSGRKFAEQILRRPVEQVTVAKPQ